MAQEVTGIIGDQDVALENAATEATLEALLQVTLSNSKNKTEAAKIQKAYEEAVKNTTKGEAARIQVMKVEQDRRKSLNYTLEQEKKRRENINELLTGLGNVVGKGLTVAFSSATPKINDFTNALSGLPVLGPVIAALGNALQANVDNFRQLSNAGADLGSNIGDVRKAAAQAGLSLDGYKKIVIENGTVLAQFAGSTSAGVLAFTRLSGELQRNVQPRLSGLGLGFEETSEFLASYLAIQTRLGRAQNMTDAQLLTGTEEYILQLDRLARLTGISRREAEETLKRQSTDKKFQAMLSTMSPKVSAEFQNLVAVLEKSSPELAQAAKEAAITGGVPLTEMGNQIALFNPEFMRMVGALANGGASMDDVVRSIQNGALMADGLGTAFKRTAIIADTQGQSIAMGFAPFIGLGNLGKDLAAVTGEQAKALENMQKRVSDVDRVFLNIRNAVMLALEPALGIFTKGMLGVGNIIDPDGPFVTSLSRFFVVIATGIENFMNVFNTQGLGAAIKSSLSGVGEYLGPVLADILSSAFAKMFSSPVVIGGLVAAITALFAARLAIAAIGRAASSQIQGPVRPGSMGMAMKGGIAGLAIGGAAGIAADALGRDTKAGASTDVLGQAASYAGTGAMLGMMLGPKGAIGGAALGGLFGLGAGLYSNRGTLFGKKDQENPGAQSQDTSLEVAAQLASITTEAEVKALAEALKQVDYSRLTVPVTAIQSIELGTNKVKNLRSEIDAMTASFKDLNNTGLEKITRGIERLSSEFKEFNRSFVDSFMTKFSELDQKSQETLLSDLNEKTDRLNISMSTMVLLQQELLPHMRNTARNTKTSTGNMLP